MITIDDVVRHIAQEVLEYKGNGEGSEIELFLWTAPFDLDLHVTNCPEQIQSELSGRPGPGYSFFLRYASYEEAAKMASQLMWKLKGKIPKIGQDFGGRPAAGKDVCLVVHIQKLSTEPGQQLWEESTAWKMHFYPAQSPVNSTTKGTNPTM
jgi:hypothetical protein